jgi:hypothetical protein
MTPEDVTLPKWCEMRVSGNKISREQAENIIIRTDYTIGYFGMGGNSEKFSRQLANALGLPRFSWALPDREAAAAQRCWRDFTRKIGYFNTSLVKNDWISSCFVFGASGWCHPNGDIFYSQNIGKWPSATELLDDWSRIAAEWPFLDLGVAVMDVDDAHADNSATQLVSIKVKDGEAHWCDPVQNPFKLRPHDRHRPVGEEYYEARLAAMSSRQEHAFTAKYVGEIASRIKKTA